MRFTKIKWDEKQVQLAWTTKRKSQTGTEEVDHALRSSERPLAAFNEALQDFVPLAAELLELDEDWLAEGRVQSVSINEEEDGRLGLVVTMLRPIERAHSPVVLNTPHLREAKDDEEEERAGFFGYDWGRALERLEAAADDYVEGKREQADLFAGDVKATLTGPGVHLEFSGASR